MMSLHLAIAFKQQQRLNLKSSVNASIQKFDAKLQARKSDVARHDESDKSSDADTTDSLSDDGSSKENQYNDTELLKQVGIFTRQRLGIQHGLRSSVDTLQYNQRVGFRGR